jgi:predicted aconitase
VVSTSPMPSLNRARNASDATKDTAKEIGASWTLSGAISLFNANLHTPSLRPIETGLTTSLMMVRD